MSFSRADVAEASFSSAPRSEGHAEREGCDGGVRRCRGQRGRGAWSGTDACAQRGDGDAIKAIALLGIAFPSFSLHFPRRLPGEPRGGSTRALLDIPLLSSPVLVFPVIYTLTNVSFLVIQAIKTALEGDGKPIDLAQVKALGLTTQRSSFTVWEKKTGKPLIPLILYKDTR